MVDSRAAVALLVALAWTGCALAQPVTVVSTSAIPVAAAAHATHDLRLAAYAFEGTRWEPQHMRDALAAAGALFTQCGIAVAADLHLLRAARRFHSLWTPDARDLLRLLVPPRPALFFVEDTRNRPSFDAEAVGRANARTRPEMADTVWVTFGTRDLAVAIAHELAHVLADSGAHATTPGNLMNEETSPDNTRLTAAQCATLRARGEASALLAPRMVKPPDTPLPASP